MSFKIQSPFRREHASEMLERFQKTASPLQKQIFNARQRVSLSAYLGNSTDFKEAIRENARLSIKNIDEAIEVPSPKITTGLFSKNGLNLIKMFFVDLFRSKSLEEKEYTKLYKEAIARQKLDYRI